MATETVLKIKTGLFSTQPKTLREGELAYSFKSGVLYIGGPNDSIDVIQGSGSSGSVATIEKNLVEYLSDTELYKGEAQNATDDIGEAVWRISHITSAVDGSSATTRFADGIQSFDKIWNDRASYSYS